MLFDETRLLHVSGPPLVERFSDFETEHSQDAHGERKGAETAGESQRYVAEETFGEEWRVGKEADGSDGEGLNDDCG